MADDEGRDLLLDAAHRLARTEGWVSDGIPTAAVLLAVVVDSDGEDHVIGRYTGGYATALGLVVDARERLFGVAEE